MLFTTNLIGVTKGIISLLQNPGNTLSVYDIEDGLKESWLQRLSLQYVKSDREHLTFVTPKLSLAYRGRLYLPIMVMLFIRRLKITCKS